MGSDTELINDQDWIAVENQFSESYPYNYAVVDKFLAAGACSQIRECLINHKGWGLMNVEGAQRVLCIRNFRQPIVNQIASVLTDRLSGILGGLALVECRAFMSCENDGLDIHSDNGLVTLNIYLTPQVFNLKPGSGGLILFDVKRSEHQALHEFNSQPWCSEYFERNTKGGKTRVGYAFNRAVLFDARTMHAAESMCFAGGSAASHRLNLALRFDEPELFRSRNERYAERESTTRAILTR